MSFKENLSKSKEYGVIEFVNHPIVRVSGLPTVEVDEVVIFENDDIGHVSAIRKNSVEIVSYSKVPPKYGTRVTKGGKLLGLTISDGLLGKVISPLGVPRFTYDSFKNEGEEKPIDIQPPVLMSRTRIKRQFVTGIAVIDSVIPLGKGQRELVVGDRKTGKTSTTLTLVKSQILEGSIVVYALIAKDKSFTKKLKEYLESINLMDSVVIVSTSPDDSPSLIDLTPYSAMTIAEYFRDNGRDVVILFDDLTTHAKYYREISLIAKKFPGRDSYPGDVFYKHARLLERAGNFKNEKSKIKEASITAIALAETINGLLSDYIVSNLISITDGHLHFDAAIFNKGRRPAIDLFLSVTRVGKQTQSQISRQLTREVMALMTKYESSSNFKHLGAELTEEIKELLKKGDQVFAFFEQSYQRALPLNMQLVFLGLIMSGAFMTSENLSEIREKKKNLYQSYKDEKVKLMIDNILEKSQTYEAFMDSLDKYKTELMELC